MLRVATLCLALLLAGCSGGRGSDDDPADSVTSPTSGGSGLDDRAAATPVPMEHPVDWDGAVVAGAWLCEGVVFGGCRAAPSDAAFGVDHVVDGLAGNVSGELTLTWTTSSAMTDQLVLDAAVMTPDCADCPFTQVAHTAGLSPLSVTLADVVLPPDAVLRLSVYVDKYVEGGALATVGGSGDQDFTVTGTLTMLA